MSKPFKVKADVPRRCLYCACPPWPIWSLRLL